MRALRPLIVIALFAVTAGPMGCSNAGSTTSTAPATSEVTSTSSPSPEINMDTQKEVSKTARVVNDMTRQLLEQGASEDDPLFQAAFGLLYGLKARIEALGAKALLATGKMEQADASMRNAYVYLARAQTLADDAVAQELAAAAEIVGEVGAPSDDPARAEQALSEFITYTSRLLEAAQATVGTGK